MSDVSDHDEIFEDTLNYEQEKELLHGALESVAQEMNTLKSSYAELYSDTTSTNIIGDDTFEITRTQKQKAREYHNYIYIE